MFPPPNTVKNQEEILLTINRQAAILQAARGTACNAVDGLWWTYGDDTAVTIAGERDLLGSVGVVVAVEVDVEGRRLVRVS